MVEVRGVYRALEVSRVGRESILLGGLVGEIQVGIGVGVGVMGAFSAGGVC